MKKLAIIIFSLIAFAFIWTQYRHFYKVDDITFTVWKRVGGYCYITPYKHYSLKPPKENYIRVSNVGWLSIFVESDSSLIIFNNKYISKDSVCINLPKQKYQYYSPDRLSIEEIEAYDERKNYNKNILPFLIINIRGMHAFISSKEELKND